MKRKVAKIGPSTLMVSLPSKWVKAYGVKQGDELDVVENNAELSIRTARNDSPDLKTIDFSSLDAMTRKAVGALYKKGYSNIQIKYNNPQQLEAIYKNLSTTCVGMEVMDSGKSHITLKQIASMKPDEFDNIMRRLFLFLNDIIVQGSEALRIYDENELKNLVLKDLNVNRYSDLARRLINSKVVQTSVEGPLYTIAEQLEKIGDLYSEIYKYALNEKVKLNPKLHGIWKDLLGMFDHFTKLFFNFKLEEVEMLSADYHAIKSKINVAFDVASKKEIRILCLLEAINILLYDLIGSLMTYKI